MLRIAIVALALVSASCGPSTRTARDTLAGFYKAVQDEDLDRLFCTMAGVREAPELGATPVERREGFDAWARARYVEYDEGREAGWVELDEQGLALVKLFALGKGTYVTYGPPVRLGADAFVVESTARFGYAHINLSRFSPGTTFYVGGAPVGRVHAIRVPDRSREVTVDLLDRVTIEWTLVRSEPAGECPGGWTVASAEPVEGSAETAAVTWAF